MDAAAFRDAGHQLVDEIAAFLEGLPERPVTRAVSPETVRATLDAGASLPETGQDAGSILERVASQLFEQSLFNGHPRFWGYITAGPAPIGILADFLASAVNANVGAWRLSPVASEIEAQTIRWIAELTGYPAGCGGILVSGGNMANTVGLFAARAAKAGWDIRKRGFVADAPRLRVYATTGTHTWIEKATDLAGLGTDCIRWIPTDADHRMDVAALRAAVDRDRKAGERPLAIVGTAGSVSVGSVDPLDEIAAFCQETGIWFHVDGAYGGLAARVPGAPAALAALGQADSVALDPHKWLYAPLEAGCTLVRDEKVLRDAFSYNPPYYHFGTAAHNYYDLGPQNSRGFRALKVWMALRMAGRAGYLQMMADDIRLSERMFARVSAHPEIEALTQALSIATFRYVPSDLRGRREEKDVAAYLNRMNETLLERLQNGGEAFVSNAIVNDRYALRACIVNFRTSEADVDALPDLVVRIGREVDAILRPEHRPL